MPEQHLREEYDKAVSLVESEGYIKKGIDELFNAYVCNRLQKIFNVSNGRILRRIEHDNLG